MQMTKVAVVTAVFLGGLMTVASCSSGSSGSGGSKGSQGAAGGGGTMGNEMDAQKDVNLEVGGPDMGKGDMGHPAQACEMMSTRVECTACCAKAFPKGHKAFIEDELTCACTPAQCGPGGTGGDGGKLGMDACMMSCGSSTPLPLSKDCAICLDVTYGNATKPHKCFKPVNTACDGDMSCKAFFGCYDKCPAPPGPG